MTSADAPEGADPGGPIRRLCARGGVPLLAALSLAACATRPEAARPPGLTIVDRPVSFSEQRRQGMLDYIREHYGLDVESLEITPRIVVLHWTAVDDLEASFRTFDRETLGGRPELESAGDVNVSIQFLVAKDGTVYRLMPETWAARHVIGLNYDAIGVENVGTGSRDGDDLTDAQIEANVALVRYLVAKHPTIDYLIGHHEYRAFEGHPLWRELDDGYRTTKIDPGDRFMAAVRAGVADLGLKGVQEVEAEAAGRRGGHRAADRSAGDTLVQRIPGTDVSFPMAYVPGGAFVLGTPDDVEGRDPDEGPRRTVVLDPFWIGVHEITADEYAVFRTPALDSDSTADPGRRLDVDAVTRPSPPYEDPAHGMGGRDRPATGMTQWAALRYARWLSEKTGRLYRLPTEAEWEMACRAGSSSDYPFDGGRAALGDHAWFIGNSGEATHPVGRKAPNRWGVHDMLGNVAEWTLDEYRADFYASLEEGAPNPWARPAAEHPRTVRGGAFDDDATEVRCGDRLESTLRWKRRDPQLPQSRWWNTDSPHVGFRLVSPARAYTLEEIRAYWEDVLGGR